MNPLTRRQLMTGGLGLLGTSTLVACAPGAQEAIPEGSETDAGTTVSHIHAIVRDPADAAVVLLATHEGLFRLRDRKLTAIGPTVDLMGFTVTPEGRYLASGHPGAGSDLPEPVGLIESTDEGKSWTVLSRGSESDFHALTASPDLVLGFDGELRLSADGRTWETLTIPSAPADLAIAPGTGAMLAATEAGVLISADGSSWQELETPQLISRLVWADAETIVGAGIDGHLLTSHDAGDTWTSSQQPVGEVTALGASVTEDGTVEALLVAESMVLRSTDGGDTTEELL